MSIALMTEVWKASLPMTEKMVLLCLADFANDRGECWPSVDTIAGKCSCSDRTVQKAIKNLKAWGILTVKDTPGKSHSFTINARNSFTPEIPSPPKDSANGVKNIRPRGERASPKPSKNHQEPSNGSAPDGALTPEDFVEDWNELAGQCNLVAIRKLSAQRRRLLQAKIKEHGFDEIAEAFGAIRRSSWMHGSNDRGWRANITWFLRPNTITRLIEGEYEQQKTTH